MKNYTRIIMPVITLVLVLALWEICVHVFSISLYLLPAPSKIATSIIENADILWKHSLVTLKEAILGLIIATIAAIIIAIGMDVSKTFKHSIFPHLIVTQTVPVMVLGPLFTIWLGFGLAPKVLMVVFMCFFPIAISFCDALGNVDRHQMNLLRSFGAKKWQIYTMVKIPSATPALFSGLKVAATYCIGGAIVGEWLSASAGLGYYMIRVKNGYMLDKVFACVIIIIILSLMLHGIVVLLEKCLCPYQHIKEKKK